MPQKEDSPDELSSSGTLTAACNGSTESQRRHNERDPKNSMVSLQGHLTVRFMERLDQIRSGTQRPRVSPDLPRPQPHAAPASGGLYTGVDSSGDVGPGAGAATIPRTPTGSAPLP